jgi:hypothetical protein
MKLIPLRYLVAAVENDLDIPQPRAWFRWRSRPRTRKT